MRQSQIVGDDAKGQRGMVRFDDVSEAFMRLPRLLQIIGEKMEGGTNQEYLMSLVSPFHYQSKKARIPNIQATQTVVATDFQDLGTFSVSSGSGLFFTQGTALNCSPWVYLDNVNQQTLDGPLLNDIQVEYRSIGTNVNVPLLVYTTSLIQLSVGGAYAGATPFLQSMQIGVPPNVRGLFTSARVVAGGSRFFKTSASTTESGVIKGFYAERGGRVTRNLAQLINYY